MLANARSAAFSREVVMRLVNKLGIALLAATCVVPAALAGCNVHLTVVVSGRVKNQATIAHSTELLCAIAAQLGLDPAQANILLVQIRPEEVGDAGVTLANPIHELHSPGRPGYVYVVWLVGDADDLRIIRLFGSTLADARGIRLSEAEFTNAVRRALLATNATVSKDSLLESHH